MKPSPCHLLVALLPLLPTSNALKFNVHGRRNQTPAFDASPDLTSRSVSAVSPPRYTKRGGNVAPLTNTADVSYYANITLNGDDFYCLIDTGSSDLWVASSSVTNAKSTGKSSSVTYAIGSVNGDIKTANLEFGGYSVSDQAFIQVNPDSSNPSGKGLIGLGPNSGSNVYHTLNNGNAGAAVANRIFLQNTSTPNFVSVNLGRIEDPDDPFPGNITVGEILDGLDSISSQPKLSVTEVSVRNAGDQHFQILLDSDGIIGPDNQSVAIKTTVSTANGGSNDERQLTAVVDTGFSLTQVPKLVSDAFYSRYDGAEYVNVDAVGDTWIVPCTTEVNITFKIGGVRYPIHPLDATLLPSIMGISNDKVVNSNGDECCIGMFQPISFQQSSDPTYDIILGMSFLRNVYALFNYGDFIDSSASDPNQNRGDPYVQLLSTTDVPSSHLDFVDVRLGGVDTTGTQVLNAFNSDADDGGRSGSSSGDNKSTLKKVFLGLAIGAGVLGLVLLIGWLACCRGRGRNNKKVKSGAGWTQYGGYGRLGEQNAPGGGSGGSYPFQGMSSTSYSAASAPPSSGGAGAGQGYGNGGLGYSGYEPRYDPVATSTNNPFNPTRSFSTMVPPRAASPNPNASNENFAGVGLGRGEAPPYSRYEGNVPTSPSTTDFSGHHLYDQHPQSGPQYGYGAGSGERYSNPFDDSRR